MGQQKKLGLSPVIGRGPGRDWGPGTSAGEMSLSLPAEQMARTKDMAAIHSTGDMEAAGHLSGGRGEQGAVPRLTGGERTHTQQQREGRRRASEERRDATGGAVR